MKRIAMIMAGGSGERFWPLSRKRKPKQLLKLTSDDKMLIEESIERISPLMPPEDIYIITGELLLDPIRASLPVIPPENVIAEPLKRNTAPCLALGAAFVAEKYSGYGLKPNEISIAILTADQSIHPKEGFLQTVQTALHFVENNMALATVGIEPARPETGYGYIEVQEKFSLDDHLPIKPVLKFHEKPNLEKAKEYLKKGNYLWNSGMFFWRLDTFMESMAKYMPEVGLKIPDMSVKFRGKTSLALPEPLETVLPIFESFPNTSIDYGLMEKAGNVVVVHASFSWDDVGSWDSLDRILPSDIAGNINSGNNIIFDNSNSVFINKCTQGKIVLSAFGLEDTVIVVTDDAVLVCPKSRVQEVKKSVEMLRERNGEKWL